MNRKMKVGKYQVCIKAGLFLKGGRVFPERKRRKMFSNSTQVDRNSLKIGILSMASGLLQFGRQRHVVGLITITSLISSSLKLQCQTVLECFLAVSFSSCQF